MIHKAGPGWGYARDSLQVIYAKHISVLITRAVTSTGKSSHSNTTKYTVISVLGDHFSLQAAREAAKEKGPMTL